MKLYKIRKWSELFENNRSRTVKELSWVAIPNRHDGENYSGIVTHKDGAIIFAAWVLLVQVASRCQPRGTLLRDNETPHSPTTLSLKTRAPVLWFEMALEYLENNTDWLDVEDVESDCHRHVSVLSPSCQAGDEEGNGTEQKEQNSTGVGVLLFLNEASGREFRPTDTNLKFIEARLREPGVDLAGVQKMILRQVKRWKGTAQAEYLRPETLFNKSKFDAYYAAKDEPIYENNGTNSVQRPDRNAGTLNAGSSDKWIGVGKIPTLPHVQ